MPHETSSRNGNTNDSDARAGRLAFALLASSLALAASSLALVFVAPSVARAQGAKKEAETVRERRVEAGEKTDGRAKKTEARDAAATPKSRDAATPKPSVDVEASAEAGATKAGATNEGESETKTVTVADIEELRTRIAAASNAARRARLQHELVERLTEAGRRWEAVELLRSMMTEERFDPSHFYNVGNALARLGESGAAVESYRKAIGQRRGHYARAQHNLGVVLTRLGRWEEAEEALTSALRQESYRYAEASYSLGRLHALRGEAGLAIEEWTRTLQLKPDHEDAAVALARALAEDGDPQAALAALDAFDERLARRGVNATREVAVARGEIVAASNVAAATAGGGESSRANEARGERTRASRRPLRTLTVEPETYDYLKRARAERAANRNGEAAVLYRRAIESNRGYFPPANLELGFALGALGRYEDAVASLLVVTTKEGARYPIAFYHLGRFYERLGRTAEASASYERAAQMLGDESPQFYLDLSRMREKEGRLGDSLAAAERYVSLMERDGERAPEWARERVEELRRRVALAEPVKK